MLMQHDLLVGNEFDQHIDGAVFLVDLIDEIGNLVEASSFRQVMLRSSNACLGMAFSLLRFLRAMP